MGMFVALLVSARPGLAESDSTTDYMRKAGIQAFHDKKWLEAIDILKKVTEQDKSKYNDYYMLATAYDKLGRLKEAVACYQQVASLLQQPNTADERQVRGDVERRLKVLDTQSEKLSEAVDEFLKKIEGVKREAETTKNTAAYEKAFRLEGAVLQAQGRTDLALCVVRATDDGMDTGFKVVEGRTYHISCHGTWHVGPAASDECTADGLPQRPPNVAGVIGRLFGSIDSGAVFPLGQEGDFVATKSGNLILVINGPTAKKTDNFGSILVTVSAR
jgi:tetratricopeptide (TPR) repeat protein